MATKIGLEAKLYRGTAGSQAATEMKNVKDLTLTVEKDEADISSRASSWALVRAKMKKGSIDFKMNWDASDADCLAIKTAFFADTALAFFVTDGAGTGLDADFEILKFAENQPLVTGQEVDVSIKPTYLTRYPAWV
jgi:hypothetical protein